jgi:hypothetical protein
LRPATPERKQPTPDTITTQDSFDTAPEISEPVEKLFEALFNPKKPKQPEVTINIMAEGKKSDVMDVDKTETRIGELKLHQPSEFTGKKDDLKYFLQKVRMYLLINKKTTKRRSSMLYLSLKKEPKPAHGLANLSQMQKNRNQLI